MIVFLVHNRDDDIFQTLRDYRLFTLNLHDITNNEFLSSFLYEDVQTEVHIKNTGVEASINPDLDHAGDDVSSNAPLDKQSIRSSKKTSMRSVGMLSTIFILFRLITSCG